MRRDPKGGLLPEPAGFSDTTFALLRDLVVQRTGVFYGDAKRELFADRITEAMAAGGVPSALDYYYRLKYDPDANTAWAELMDHLAVPETYFWRQPDQFVALVELLMPAYLQARRRDPVRIWCAACCTGEEPLSIAMALAEGGWFERLPIEIRASDASPAMVARARRGVYGARSVRNLTEERRRRFFQPEGERWKVDPALHARVEWSVANLVDPAEAGPLARADVIFCRNVLIYFSDDAIRRVARLFADGMPASGHLFLGSSESLTRLTSDFVLQELGPAFVYVPSAGSSRA